MMLLSLWPNCFAIIVCSNGKEIMYWNEKSEGGEREKEKKAVWKALLFAQKKVDRQNVKKVYSGHIVCTLCTVKNNFVIYLFSFKDIFLEILILILILNKVILEWYLQCPIHVLQSHPFFPSCPQWSKWKTFARSATRLFPTKPSPIVVRGKYFHSNASPNRRRNTLFIYMQLKSFMNINLA